MTLLSWDRDFRTINLSEKDMVPNEYFIKLHIEVTTNELIKQNICFERIKFFTDFVADKTVMTFKGHKKLASLKKLTKKQQWMELPSHVFDQSVGIAMYCKLQAITYPYFDIKAVEISSDRGDNVNYVYEDDQPLGVYDKSRWFKKYDFLDPWWHRSDLATYDKITKLDDGQVTWYNGPVSWQDIGLAFNQNYKEEDGKKVDEVMKNNILNFPTKWTPKIIDGRLDNPK